MNLKKKKTVKKEPLRKWRHKNGKYEKKGPNIIFKREKFIWKRFKKIGFVIKKTFRNKKNIGNNSFSGNQEFLDKINKSLLEYTIVPRNSTVLGLQGHVKWRRALYLYIISNYNVCFVLLEISSSCAEIKAYSLKVWRVFKRIKLRYY